MNNIEFKLIPVFFKLKSTLKRILGKDMSSQVLDRTKHYYIKLEKSKPKEKGLMKLHRIL